MDLRNLIFGLLLYFYFPLWVLAGIGDYLCHRRTSIERTSGVHESELHVPQAIEIGVPLLAGLFLEINALVLAVMIVFVFAHTLTALWDASYAAPRRYISPLEQHIHSHLEYIPIVTVSLVVIVHWNQFIALLGLGDEPASFALRLSEHPIPAAYLLAILVPILIVHGVLLFEELFRTWRAARHAPTRANY